MGFLDKLLSNRLISTILALVIVFGLLIVCKISFHLDVGQSGIHTGVSRDKE